MDLQRVLVLGCPGSGKTTLAGRMAEARDLPLHHLDDLYWGAGWTPLPVPRWEAAQRALIAGDRWIIEGNYLDTIDLRSARAEEVVVLDTSTPRCLARVVRRAWRIWRGDRSALPAGVRAGLRPGEEVRATTDFAALLRKVARFRSADLDGVVERALSNPAVTVTVASGRSTWLGRLRRRRLRSRLHHPSVHVVAMADVLDGTWPLPG